MQQLGPSDEAAAKSAGTDAAKSASPAPRGLFSWGDLAKLPNDDPDAVRKYWQKAMAAAREELRDGSRGVGTLAEVVASSPWRLARLFAVREELSAGWSPRDGFERLLVDEAAQAYTLMVYWRERVTAVTARCLAGSRREAGGEPPQPGDAEELEQAMHMLERFHALYCRTLKALQDTRRHRPAVVVGRAGQVNVSENQVNLNYANG
jgi:hypothetical protein